MTRLWKFLFLLTWVVIIGIIIFLSISLASSQSQSQQQIINQYVSKDSGMSAYEIAVKKGFNGTELDWLASLKGADGSNSVSTQRVVHTKSVVIEQVPLNGEKGSDGQSSYDTWLSLGNTGTQQDYLDSLKGEEGRTVTTLIRFNETSGKFETKLSTDTFWKVVPICGGTSGKVCN